MEASGNLHCRACCFVDQVAGISPMVPSSMVYISHVPQKRLSTQLKGSEVPTSGLCGLREDSEAGFSRDDFFALLEQCDVPRKSYSNVQGATDIRGGCSGACSSASRGAGSLKTPAGTLLQRGEIKVSKPCAIQQKVTKDNQMSSDNVCLWGDERRVQHWKGMRNFSYPCGASRALKSRLAAKMSGVRL